jgi:hypothetical protein
MAKQRKRPPRSRWSSPHPLFPDPGEVYQRGRQQYQDLMAWMSSAVEPGPKKAPRGRRPAHPDALWERHFVTYPAGHVSDERRVQILTAQGHPVTRKQVRLARERFGIAPYLS